MSTTHTMPSGATVTLRDPLEVTERQNRSVMKSQVRLMASSPEFTRLITEQRDTLEGVEGESEADKAARGSMLMAALGEAGYEASEEVNDALIGVLVESWSGTAPGYLAAPSADTAADLPKADYAALKELAAEVGKPLITADTEPNPDPASPTQP